jgi:HrpA-like RNA helicase
MSDGSEPRGTAVTETWGALCKDCVAELAAAAGRPVGGAAGKGSGSKPTQPALADEKAKFHYSGDWVEQKTKLGQSRSDRCPGCRRKHAQMIQAYAVAYVDVKAIGSVDPANPTGPLGGLGPLPVTHERDRNAEVKLMEFQFGLTDDDIIDLLDGLSHGKRVAVLEAGTGTGKSTFGPFRLMRPPKRPRPADRRALYFPTAHGPIVVTEPRIPATTGVATFVGESLCFGHKNCTKHIGPGYPVGYQKKGEKNWDDACQLIYVTDGSLINWIREGRLARIGMVIVDEAHERSENIDLILALLADQLPRYPHLRVIIASATIDKNFFVEYFGGEANVHHKRVDAVKGVGYGVPMFPDLELTKLMIEEDGLGDDELVGHFDPWPHLSPDGKDDLWAHTRLVAELAATEEIDKSAWKEKMPEAVAAQVLRLLEGTDSDSGDILAFLPTKALIKRAYDLVQKGQQGHAKKASVYQLLSSIDEPTKKKALAASKPGTRKVVISSNLAETSLTVSGVRYVVDSGLICQDVWDPAIAQGSLPTIPHSQSGVRQRWGRVGRDQPGWVFPLYTRAQFAKEMPRNTPPGSTRANLEQFLIKLKGAGVDRPGDIVMPGNFANENYQPPDTDARRAAQVFEDEVRRAERALESNGAVDGQGHLTAFGRELEHFTGSPEHAMAIMFADRLACVPEVGHALSILANGRIVDRDGLLRFDYSWPPAWRVQATLCHRGLAVDCKDDLDLALRVCAAWQRADDPEGWARRWWVNHELLVAAADDTKNFVAMLSPAMKEEAQRPVQVGLIPRTRAVLSRALASVTYQPIDGTTWQSEMDRTTGPVGLGKIQLVDVSGPVLALARYRPPKKEGMEDPSPVIQGLVKVTPWARGGGDGPGGAPDGFDLLVRAAHELGGVVADPVAEALGELQAALPVGSVVAVPDFSPRNPTQRVARVYDPPDPGGDLPNLDGDEGGDDDEAIEAPAKARRHGLRSAGEEAAEFDIARPRPVGAATPEEEVASRPENLLGLEENDDPPTDNEESPTEPPIEEPRSPNTAGFLVDVPVKWEENPGAAAQLAAMVSGYQIENDEPVLVLRTLSSLSPRTLTPAAMKMGSDVTVTVRGDATDHVDRYRILEIDGGGEVLESEMAGSLDPGNKGWILDLEKDSTWPGVVVPGHGAKDPHTVTLLPYLHSKFARQPATGIKADDKWYRGTIVPTVDRDADTVDDDTDDEDLSPQQRPSDRRPAAVIELDMSVRQGLAAYRFIIQAGKAASIADAGDRAKVEVRIGSLRAKLPRKIPRGEDKILDELAGELERSNKGSGYVTTGTGPLSSKARLTLLRAAPNNPSWERAVWRFWRDSYRFGAFDARMAGSRQEIEVSTGSAAAVVTSKLHKEISEKHDVKVDIDRTTGIVSVVGEDPTDVAAAMRDIADLTAGPTVTVKVPSDRVLRLKRRNKGQQSLLQRTRETPGIVSCKLENNGTLTITGTNDAAVAQVITDIRELIDGAQGTVTLSSDSYTARVKGTGSRTVEGMRVASGCTHVSTPRAGSGQLDYVVSGPTSDNLEQFLARVRYIDPYATLHDIASGVTEVTDNASGRTWQPARSADQPRDGANAAWRGGQPAAAAPQTPTIQPTRISPRSAKPVFTNPSGNGQMEASEPFKWTSVPGADDYRLTVGTTVGGHDLINSGPLGPDVGGCHVPGLFSGQQLHARVWASVNSEWVYADVTFTVAPTQPTLLWPTNRQADVDTTRPFSWSTVRWATGYWLIIGTVTGGHDLLNTGQLPPTQSSYSPIPRLPSGLRLYARLLASDGTNWTAAADVVFSAAARERWF